MYDTCEALTQHPGERSVQYEYLMSVVVGGTSPTKAGVWGQHEPRARAKPLINRHPTRRLNHYISIVDGHILLFCLQPQEEEKKRRRRRRECFRLVGFKQQASAAIHLDNELIPAPSHTCGQIVAPAARLFSAEHSGGPPERTLSRSSRGRKR